MKQRIERLLDKQNIFLLLLVVMVLMAKFFPFQESYNQYFNLSQCIDWGIAGIFLLYGLKLNIKDVVRDVSNWKLHVIVQFGTIFLSISKEFRLFSNLVNDFLFGSFTIYRFVVCRYGFYCKRKCNVCNF